MVHKVPEALSPPCLRDFGDHSSGMPYNIVNNTINTQNNDLHNFSGRCNGTWFSSRKTGDICVPPRFKCVLLGLSFLDPQLPVGVVSV